MTYEDGGTSALDLFETSEMEDTTPIFFIIRTYTGGTREPCANKLVETAVKRGLRAVVLNNRCCSGEPITSSRMIAVIEIDDAIFAVDLARKCPNLEYIFIRIFTRCLQSSSI